MEVAGRSRGFGGISVQRDDGETFTIVTRAANEFVVPLHARMPLLLPHEAYHLWMFGEQEIAAKLIVSAPGTEMGAHRVSERVNTPSANGAEPIAAVEWRFPPRIGATLAGKWSTKVCILLRDVVGVQPGPSHQSFERRAAVHLLLVDLFAVQLRR